MQSVFDKRTEEYIESIKQNMKLVVSNAGEEMYFKDILTHSNVLEQSQLEEIGRYQWKENASDIVIYTYQKEGKKRYCAEYEYRAGVDNTCVETHIFDKYPALEDVQFLWDMNKFESLVLRGLKTEITCSMCESKIHWLDIKGDFKEKMMRLDRRYCGC